MEYFILSLEIVFPLFVLMAVGYCIKKTGFMTDGGFNTMNRMVFYVLLPQKLFIDVFRSDFRATFQVDLLCFVLIGTLLSFFALCASVSFLVKEKGNAASIIQGMYRSNFVIYGLSVAANMYPGMDLGVISFLIAFVVPLFNVLAIILFEYYRGNNVDLTRIGVGILKNPLVVSSVAALAFSFSNVTLPETLLKPVAEMGAAATPLAIICLGASFTFAAIKSYAKELIACCTVKLAAIPAVFVSAAVFFGYRDLELAAVMLVFATPTAASSYTMAKELGGNSVLSGMIVAVTSITSLFTMFLWILALKLFQLL